MDTHEISKHLHTLLVDTKSVFVKTEPETLDFTNGLSAKIHVSTQNGTLEFEINSQNILVIIGMLSATIFEPEKVDRLYTWNFKSLTSYVLYNISKFVTPKNNCIDLKPIEGFLGVHLNSPKNYFEALDRVKLAVKRGGWHQVYKQVHQPLFLRVLPSIETTPLLNLESRRPEYPCYEIEGQTNGRLNSRKAFLKSYLPQTMGNDVKSIMRPHGYGVRFVTSDFRHCEVTVLQWLSNDERLLEILESGEDLHRRIYEIVTGDKCDSDKKRNLSKKLFLPVIYGCGPFGLSKNLSINENVAKELIDRIFKSFPTATNWIMEKQQQAMHGVVKDYFGRPRSFKSEEVYLARNFVVQGVAATVCQEHLIEVHKSLKDGIKIVFSVHDGYCFVIPTAKAKEMYIFLKEKLEAESKLCPGLRMKIEVKFGARLDQMKVLWK